MGKKAWRAVFLVLWAGATLSLCPLLFADEERDQDLDQYLDGVVQKVMGQAFLFDGGPKVTPSEDRVRQALMDKDPSVAMAGARELLFYPGLVKEALGPGLAGMPEQRKALLQQTLFDLGGLAAEWVLQHLEEPYQGTWADGYRRYFLERKNEGYGTVRRRHSKDGAAALPGEKLEGKGAGPKPSVRYLQLAYHQDGLQIFRYTELAYPAGANRSISGEFLVFRKDGHTLQTDASRVFWVFPGHWDGESGSGSGGEWVFWTGPGNFLYSQGYGESGSVFACSFSEGRVKIQSLARTGPPAYPLLPEGNILFHGLPGDTGLYALDLVSLKDKQVVEGHKIHEVGESVGDGVDLPVMARMGLDHQKKILYYGIPLLPLENWERPLADSQNIDSKHFLQAFRTEYERILVQAFGDSSESEKFSVVEWSEAARLKEQLKPLGQGRWRLNLEAPFKRRVLVDFRLYRSGEPALAVLIDRMQLMEATKDGFETIQSLPGALKESQ